MPSSVVDYYPIIPVEHMRSLCARSYTDKFVCKSRWFIASVKKIGKVRFKTLKAEIWHKQCLLHPAIQVGHTRCLDARSDTAACRGNTTHQPQAIYTRLEAITYRTYNTRQLLTSVQKYATLQEHRCWGKKRLKFSIQRSPHTRIFTQTHNIRIHKGVYSHESALLCFVHTFQWLMEVRQG